MDLEISHHGLRWRLDERPRGRTLATAVLVAGVAVMWLGWAAILGVMVSVTRVSLGEGMLRAILAAPIVGNALALVVGAAAARVGRRELVADPYRVELRRPWPLRSEAWHWSAIQRVRTAGDALWIDLADRSVRIERGWEDGRRTREVAEWLELARSQAGARPTQMPPPPPSLLATRAAGRRVAE